MHYWGYVMERLLTDDPGRAVTAVQGLAPRAEGQPGETAPGAGAHPGSESVLQRSDGDHAAADPAYDVAGGLAERPGPGGVGDLAAQVDQLLDPPHEVAGGQVALVEHLGEVVALGTSGTPPRPGRRRGGAGSRAGARRSTSDSSRHSSSSASIARRVSPPGTRAEHDVLGPSGLVDQGRQRGRQPGRVRAGRARPVRSASATTRSSSE